MLKQILSEFLVLPGVTTAALVGRDGFVIDMAAHDPTDPDALGALGSSSFDFFEKSGAFLESGRLRQMMLEYQNGAIILTPVSREEFLMVLTDSLQDLGHLAFQISTTSLRVAAAM